MNKLFLIGFILLLLVGVIYVSDVSYNNKEVDFSMDNRFQGPVPQGYNLEHFRNTGETIKEVED